MSLKMQVRASAEQGWQQASDPRFMFWVNGGASAVLSVAAAVAAKAGNTVLAHGLLVASAFELALAAYAAVKVRRANRAAALGVQP